jgi:hypothetical protein
MASRDARGASGLRAFLDRIDTAVDATLNRTFDPTKPVTAVESTKRAGRFTLKRAAGASRQAAAASKKVARLQRRGLSYISSLAAPYRGKSPIHKIIAHPRLIFFASIVITIMLTAPAVFLFGAPSLGIKSGMRADLEVFLPQDDPATVILQQIREKYSTEILLALFDLYIPGANITSIEWMKQVSAFEGDEEFTNQTGDIRGVDYRLDDIGQIDGVNWTFSAATIVKVANVSTSNLMQALHDQYGFPPQNTIPNSQYSIPNDQTFIDSTVEKISPDQRKSLIINRENESDMPYNRLVVLFGLTKDPAQQEHVIRRAAALASEMNAKNGGNMVVRITGPVIVFRDLQQGVSKELSNAFIPIMLGLVGVLYFWHRNLRVLLLCLVPVSMASGMAYGIVGAAHAVNPQLVVLAPQVVLAAPMLLAIGVSYGLYIANKFVEEVGPTREERISAAVIRINPAIFLSAVATGIGFFALMIGTLPPIWTLGLALSVGIALTYILVYALIPVFVVMFGYEKRVAFKDWKRIASFPERHRILIVFVSLLLVGASLGVLAAGRVSFDVDYLTMTPEHTPSVDAMREYSATMGGGQLGIVLTRGNFQQVDSLDEIDALERQMQGLDNVQAISLVTVMKLIRSPDEVALGPLTVPLPANASFWDLLHATDSSTNQGALLAIFYASIPVEMRSMLVDDQFQSSVIYILMPFLPVDKTRVAVDAVNDAVDESATSEQQIEVLHMAGIQTVTLAVNDLIIEGQIISLIVALSLTFAHIWLVFGDLKVALFTMAPVSVVSTLEPLILVLMNIPLSTVTVMIGSIAVGTGVDFAVQLTQRMRLEGYTQASLNGAVEKAGVSFVEATSTMVAGFAGMLVMNIASIQQFVLMIILLLVLNMIMAIFLFPALGTIWINRRKKVPPPEGLYVKIMQAIKASMKPPKPHPTVEASVHAETR